MSPPARTLGDAAGGALSPCDLRALPAKRWVTVGGRWVNHASDWWVADALDRLPVTFAASAPSPSDGGRLTRLGGYWDGQAITNGSIHWTSESSLPPSEFSRMSETGLGRRLQARARALEVAREFFRRRGFLEVDTPLQTIEHAQEPHVEPIACAKGHLITSPELHMKRLLVAGLPRIFQLARCFRKDEDGPLHSPEFLMLEWYRAFSSMEAVLQDTEDLVRQLCQELTGSLDLSLPSGRTVDLGEPFRRLTVRDAFRDHAGIQDAQALAEADEDTYFQVLVDRIEPALARDARPTFLWQYPISQAALAQPLEEDPNYAERFELYLDGVELCNGYGELTHPAVQRARFESDRRRRQELGRADLPTADRFLAALEQGMPAAGGNALGFDRLLALLLGCRTITEVCSFPGEAAFR